MAALDIHPPATRMRDPAALALLSAAVLLITANNAISPALPGLLKRFAGTPDAALLVRLLVPAPSLAVLLCAPFAGELADRIGRRRMLSFGALLFAVAGSAGAVLPTLPLILAARVLQGVAVAAIMTGQAALVGDLFAGADRNRFMGAQTSARNLGGLVFIFVGGALAALSPRLPFLIYGLALAWILFARPVLRDAEGRRAVAADRAPGGAAWLPAVLGIAALNGLATMLFFVMPTQMPFYAQHLGHAPELATSWILGGVMLAGGGAALFYARLSARLGRAGALAAGFGLMAAGFAALQAVQAIPALIGGAALVGAGYALVFPAFIAMTLDAVPAARRGRASGIVTTGLYLGQVVSPFASQPAIAALGWQGALLGVAALLAVLAVGVLARR